MYMVCVCIEPPPSKRAPGTEPFFSVLTLGMNDILVIYVKIIHILVRFFLVATPFLGDELWLSLHLVCVPFVFLHWATNNTVCALTEMEKYLSGQEDTFFGSVFTPIYRNESFVGVLLSPFHEVKTKDEEKRLVWLGLGILWFITFLKLLHTGFGVLASQFTLHPR
jgi:hypothetical protein